MGNTSQRSLYVLIYDMIESKVYLASSCPSLPPSLHSSLHTQQVYGRNRGHFIYTLLPLSVYIYMYVYTHSHRRKRWLQLQLTLDRRRAGSRFCVLVSLGLGHYVVTATHTQGRGPSGEIGTCCYTRDSLYIYTHTCTCKTHSRRRHPSPPPPPERDSSR